MLGAGTSDTLSLGQLGSIYVDNTTAQTGDFGILYALTDVTFSALTSGNGVDGTACTKLGASVASLNSAVIPAGGALYGRFSGFTLASGKLMAYKVS